MGQTMPVDRTRIRYGKRQSTALAKLVAEQEKLDELEKMVKRQTSARDRAIAACAKADISHADIGRTLKISKARVWQILKAGGHIVPKPAGADDQADDNDQTGGD